MPRAPLAEAQSRPSILLPDGPNQARKQDAGRNLKIMLRKCAFGIFLVPNRRPSAVLSIMDTKDAAADSRGPVDRARSAGIESDRARWGQFLSAHRNRLRRMVALRLDHRLRGRIDPSDVIQEAFLEATERRPEYARQSDPMSPFLWLRFLTLQRLQIVHRQQLGTKSRNAGRDVSINTATLPAASSAALAAQLLGPRNPEKRAEVAIRAERKRRLAGRARTRMDAIDREVLVLRALRAAHQRRMCARSGSQRVGGDQALHLRP